jgi:hypothetical protein
VPGAAKWGSEVQVGWVFMLHITRFVVRLLTAFYICFSLCRFRFSFASQQANGDLCPFLFVCCNKKYNNYSYYCITSLHARDKQSIEMINHKLKFGDVDQICFYVLMILFVFFPAYVSVRTQGET